MRSAPRLSGRTFSARRPPCPSPRSPPGALPRFQKGRPRGDRAGAPGPAHPRQGLRAHGPRVRRPRLRPARAHGAAARVQARSRGCGQGSSSAQARTPTGARTHARAGAPRGAFPAPARARGSAALPAGLVARALGVKAHLAKDCCVGRLFVRRLWEQVCHTSSARSTLVRGEHGQAATSCPLVRNLLVPAHAALSLLSRGLEL